MYKKLILTALAVLTVVAFGFSFWFEQPSEVHAFAITPVTYSLNAGQAQLIQWFNNTSITADTRKCVEAKDSHVADIQYVLDQSAVNTTTLKLQWSNSYNLNSNTGTVEDTGNLVATSVADAHGGSQQALFGRYQCVLVDVANATPVAVTVIGVGK